MRQMIILRIEKLGNLLCGRKNEMDMYHLFIDEKGQFSPKDKADEPFILLGVSVQQQHLEDFYQEIMHFNSYFAPW